jgi:hypothetical protein
MRTRKAKRHLLLSLLGLLAVGMIACSQQPDAATTSPSPSIAASLPTATEANSDGGSDADLTQLFSRMWQITDSSTQPGSLYVFLPNGTLLQTSCVETYRIATWTIDKAAPQTLRVVEDGQLAFTATIAELNDTTLKLQQTLVKSNEKRDLALTAVDQEFLCPDLPR